MKKPAHAPTAPYLSKFLLNREAVPSFDTYPFCLPVIRSLTSVRLHPRVTFIVGENGSGKSTLLEALAVAWGLNAEGGSRNFRFTTRASHSDLAEYLKLARTTSRPTDDFFVRAESFFNLATEIERLDESTRGGPITDGFGGTSLHEQSHGESFLNTFIHRFRGHGFYILDEPEAALSPMRQMSLVARLHQLVQDQSQFVIATHSPILMSYPDATILEAGPNGLRKVNFRDTEHFSISHAFLSDPDRMLKILMEKR